MVYVIAAIILAVGWFGYRSFIKARLRADLLGSALTDHERARVAALVPLVTKLPPDIRAAHEGKMCLFLHQVDFYGKNGLNVTEDMQLSIAAQACLLVANRDKWYKYLRTILLYPTAFKSLSRSFDGYVMNEREVVRIGESWSKGPVVLSWGHSHQGGLNAEDGHNVVLHEFAHQFDDLSGATDGIPVLAKGQSYADWAKVFKEGFVQHLEDTEAGRATFLDPYGATGPEEFFAVAVEVFFEKPQGLKEHEPAIYDKLSALFQLDPIGWA